MPEWPWPADVDFDHVAAQNAIDAVESARYQLERDWARDDAAARWALAAWDGMAATQFREALAARSDAVHAAVGQLGSLQRALEFAVDEALNAEAAVALRREQWRAEERQEEWLSDGSDRRQDFRP